MRGLVLIGHSPTNRFHRRSPATRSMSRRSSEGRLQRKIRTKANHFTQPHRKDTALHILGSKREILVFCLQ